MDRNTRSWKVMGSYFSFLWSPCHPWIVCRPKSLMTSHYWTLLDAAGSHMQQLWADKPDHQGFFWGPPEKHLLWGVSWDYSFCMWVTQKIGGEFFGGYSWEPRPLRCYKRLKSWSRLPCDSCPLPDFLKVATWDFLSRICNGCVNL